MMSDDRKPWDIPVDEMVKMMSDSIHNSPKEETPKSEFDRLMQDAEDGYFEDD